MSRFTVYALKQGGGLIVDLQADLLDGLTTRIVAPLIPTAMVTLAIERLNPRFVISGETYLLATHLLSAINESEIGPAVATLAEQQDRIFAATDFAFQGF